ncbi:metallophosphoesterase family protein [Aeromicrobium alkaliterrae]|uniref:Metallophosphoesterase family protein n=1 Tax=Aeromicrobium alkaliterrae TaxID=302168 RepID=A0ABN2JHV1_9ACTN
MFAQTRDPSLLSWLSRPLARRLAITVVLAAAIVAVVAVRTGAGQDLLPADDGTATAQPDRIIANPTAEAATGQTFTWRTNEATRDGEVQIAPADSPDDVRTVQAQTSVSERLPRSRYVARHHSATVEDLEPATAYTYRVGQGDHFSEWTDFTTPPAEAYADPWTFLYFGDAQWGLDAGWTDVVDQAFTENPEAVLALTAGDQVNDGNDDHQWEQWFAAIAPWASTRTFLTLPGNHELYGDEDMIRYRSQVEYPDNGPKGQDDLAYRVDVGGVRFITLNGNITASLQDTTDNGLGALQAEWLEEQLADNPMTWTVVSIHQPMFSAAKLRDNVAQRTAFMPLLEEYGVDLVLQGHDHAYARGHLAENDVPGGYAGPTYVVANAGDKYYDLDPANRNNWTINDAERDAAADKISTYQSIRVEQGRLVYTSHVGKVGDPGEGTGPTPTGLQPGDVLDTFTVTKDAEGRPLVTQ